MKLQKVVIGISCMLVGAFAAQAQGFAESMVTLDSCRSMAVAHNKQMLIADAKIRKAEYQKKEASAAYLPSLDFTGAYFYNQKKLSVFDSDQLLPTKTFNLETQAYEFNLVKNPLTGEPIKGPDGQYVPETVALIPKDAMTFDIHNVFFGALTLTQPVYMGGKIRALNKMAGYATELNRTLRDRQAEDIVVDVDAMYWQIVSLTEKEKLAMSYISLLDTLHYNVECMLREGIATRSDLLTVEVKRNSADVDLVKVRDGIVLSRMALAQLCGLPVDTPMRLADENAGRVLTYAIPSTDYTMADVYARRPDVQALELAVKIRGEEANVARSSFLPNLAVMGAYTFSTPNMFDGFKNRVGGAFSVGAVLTVPLWHWQGDYNKYRSARTEENIARLELEDAKEKIELQVSQSAFRCREALKTHEMTLSNIDKANENLRQATLGYAEGVMTISTVMEAQTAWLKAQSENIDAEIDIRLCDVYLAKALGNLRYPESH